MSGMILMTSNYRSRVFLLGVRFIPCSSRTITGEFIFGDRSTLKTVGGWGSWYHATHRKS